MHFVWFWTFWHWSKESFREGLLLRSPLHGIGGHWDEWFRHEASQNDCQAIEKVGRAQSSQRQFIRWLLRRWARDTELRGNPLARRFVLGQLAHVQPFNEWAAFDKYRASYGVGGISAIVLTEESAGEAEDVRLVEALALPADSTAPVVVSDGFLADSLELEMPRRAAGSLLRGRGFLYFLALWLVSGRRPYPRWLKAILGLGWLAVGGAILFLLWGPDPDRGLVPLGATLMACWSGLMLVAVSMAIREGFRAWRQGRTWDAQLEKSQLRLRMSGGLTLKGGSAGLPFCLNILHSISRANSRLTPGSWLWQQLFGRLRSEGKHWAATGSVTVDGYLKPVVLEAKLRACVQRDGIKHLLTPRQDRVRRQAINRLDNLPTVQRHERPPSPSRIGGARLGFAAEKQFLHVHPYRHVAQAMMCLGGLTCTRQRAVNVFAAIVSCAMLFALPDLRSILLPPPSPAVVAPSSPSPYHLWVSLDTRHPGDFQVVLESNYWANRKANVARHSGANASVRAEILLHRLAGQQAEDGEDGTIWIERRRHFLGREFAPGDRVGRYSVSYVNRLTYE